MLIIDIYKNGEFTRYKDLTNVILQKSGVLEIFFKDEGGTVLTFQPEEFDCFNILLK